MSTVENKINLLDLTREQMKEFLVSLGEKPFRADQLMKWIYHFCIDDFDKMTNINKDLREKLKRVCVIEAPVVVTRQDSADGTIKFVMGLKGGQEVRNCLDPGKRPPHFVCVFPGGLCFRLFILLNSTTRF